MIATNKLRQIMLVFSLLFLRLTGCISEPTRTMTIASSTPARTASISPTATPIAPQQEGLLSMISPLESTEVSGGGEFRIALYLVDHEGLPV